MMAAPTFAIATPTRNSLDKLKRCVGSLRGQIGISVEHLIQDAESSDGTPAWLATQHTLASVSERDNGMYDAINRAWSRSRGRYLAWLNSDEQYLPGTLARVSSFFDQHPTVDVLFADYVVADPHGRPIAVRREIPLRRFYIANTFLNAQSCTLFFRRDLWDQGLLQLNTEFRYAADKDLVLRLLGAGVRFHHLPEVLSVFGVDGTNLSTHRGMEQEAEQIRLVHGGFRCRPLRGLALAGRRLERLVRGGYRPAAFRYHYALDEIPTYAAYDTGGVGGRYSLSDSRCQAKQGAQALLASTDRE